MIRGSLINKTNFIFSISGETANKVIAERRWPTIWPGLFCYILHERFNKKECYTIFTASCKIYEYGIAV